MATNGLSAIVAPPAAPAVPTGMTLSVTEIRTLRRLLALIKSGRSDAKSRDHKVAEAAAQRLATTFGYLVGFLDGKGVIGAVHPGYMSVFESHQDDDPEATLDALEKLLEEAVDPTRIAPLVVVAVLGASALYAVGAYLLSS